MLFRSEERIREKEADLEPFIAPGTVESFEVVLLNRAATNGRAD